MWTHRRAVDGASDYRLAMAVCHRHGIIDVLLAHSDSKISLPGRQRQASDNLCKGPISHLHIFCSGVLDRRRND